MDTNEKWIINSIIAFSENNYVVNIIKLISDSKYEIIYKIELPNFGPCTYAIKLVESWEGNSL